MILDALLEDAATAESVEEVKRAVCPLVAAPISQGHFEAAASRPGTAGSPKTKTFPEAGVVTDDGVPTKLYFPPSSAAPPPNEKLMFTSGSVN